MRRLAGVLLVAGLSVPAISQRPDPDPRLSNRLTGKLRDAVIAIVDSAREANLPTEPLIDRALEGVMKKGSDAAIVASVRNTARDLERAKRALGPNFTDEDIKAGMHAIKAGVDIKQLERLRAARSGQRIATAINVLDYLVLLRLDPDTAANVIVSLVLASATDDQLMALKADIERDLGAGTPASSAITVRGQQLAAMIAGAQNNGGVPGSTLPSGLGSTRPADPAANAALGGGAAAGNATTGGSKAPAPAGKPPAPKKP
jgi:hypothetical protein